MFPKKSRASTQHIQKALKKGVTKNSDNFSVRVSKHDSPACIAVVVSKKVAATAVARNKLKRRVRNSLRNTPLGKNKTFVVYAKKGAHNLSIKNIHDEVILLLQ